MGAGPIGCELAQAFCRLGSKVTLLEAAPRILINDEPEAAELLTQHLVQDGVDLRLNATVQAAGQDSNGIHLDLGDDEATGDTLLLAVGRSPNVCSLDLDKASVEHDSKGIRINQRLRTTHKRIYAAGDCAGGYQFTHYAGWQGVMAVRNAFMLSPTRGVLDHVPWATFTDPEVAHVGLTESQARDRFGDGVMICHWPMTSVDRAVAESDTSGFVKLVHRSNGTVLGATIVAGRAGEMIHEWGLAIDQKLKVGQLAQSIHIYPTYSISTMQIAAKLKVDQVLSGNTGRLVKGLAR